MKVILKDDVKNVGDIGQIVDVSDGYARNYLVPKGLAVEANMKNIKALEHQKRIIQEKVKKIIAETREQAIHRSNGCLAWRAYQKCIHSRVVIALIGLSTLLCVG